MASTMRGMARGYVEEKPTQVDLPPVSVVTETPAPLETVALENSQDDQLSVHAEPADVETVSSEDLMSESLVDTPAAVDAVETSQVNEPVTVVEKSEAPADKKNKPKPPSKKSEKANSQKKVKTQNPETNS